MFVLICGVLIVTTNIIMMVIFYMLGDALIVRLSGRWGAKLRCKPILIGIESIS